jgi:integrase
MLFLESREGSPLHPLWRLLAVTGMRRGEACGLKWGDLDLDADPASLTVRRTRVPVEGGDVIESSTKTGRVRVVDLDGETADILRALRRRGAVVPLDDRDAYVFTDDAGKAIGPNSASYQVRLAVRASGLRAIPLHGLRHTHASILAHNRVPSLMIAQRLGHANPNITRKVYEHCFATSQKVVVDVVSRIGRTEAQ